MMEMWLRGVRREWDYPVLMSGEDLAVTDEKAEMMAEVFVQVHSLANLSEERQTGG
jgi:Cu/Ag efflux pump CusA